MTVKKERKMMDIKFRTSPVGASLNGTIEFQERLKSDMADGWEVFDVYSNYVISGDGVGGAGSFFTMVALVKYEDVA
jgi:hypothetical protein